MEEVRLDGVVYVKASVVAKRFRYTSDYIGQLCRAKKIDARLVGRTWYVNPDSVIAHKKQTYQSKKKPNAAHESLSAESAQQATVRSVRRIEPVLSTKVARRAITTNRSNEASTEKRLPISYSVDDGHLIPELQTVKTKPQFIPVGVAESQDVAVAGSDTAAAFAPEALPDVALSGQLSVHDISEEQAPAGVNQESSSIPSRTVTLKRTKARQSASSEKLVTVAPQSPIKQKTVSSSTVSARGQKKIRMIKRDQQLRRTSATAVGRNKSAVKVRAMRSNVDAHASDDVLQVRDLPHKTALAVSAVSSTSTQRDGSLLQFFGLLLLVIGCGLAVGYFLVVSSSEYTVTASAAAAR